MTVEEIPDAIKYNCKTHAGSGVITVNSVKCQMQYTEDCSIINMMQELVYVHERDDVAAYFYVFCVHNLDQRHGNAGVSRACRSLLSHSLTARSPM